VLGDKDQLLVRGPVFQQAGESGADDDFGGLAGYAAQLVNTGKIALNLDAAHVRK
jgi:hypothetical protein